jgi:hypothetical protein
VAVGYLACGAALAGYAWRVISRGRRVSAQVPQERRRWM